MKAGKQQWYELEPEPDHGLRGRYLLAAAAVAMVYIAFIAWVAGATGAFYIMFPELGALAYDVFGAAARTLEQFARASGDHSLPHRRDWYPDHAQPALWICIRPA